ncbi:hypothetical protein [Jiella marina]|uniref:hypothetical protein n=1 Tax=Jiella sp. LLJ827 TaxID=2917712 RepID=UPI0021011971|nr:hypothetical protein [Jiella sp. LLJ827]MCQ0990196.1 hypothetical protein [Jiella sp. LLJ827]
MRFKALLAAVAVAGLSLAGCATTSDAVSTMNTRWVGQSSDAFFSAYGPPMRQFPRADGGSIYTWIGGQTTVRRNLTPPPRPQQNQFDTSPFGRKYEKSTTRESVEADGTVVRRTTSSSASVNFDPSQLLGALGGAQPQPTYEEKRLYCEVQLTAAPDGTITNFVISRDTEAEGFGLSRCAEIFAVEAS